MVSGRLYPFDLPDAAALEPLADLLDEHLAARAVIHGATPGRSFADDPRRPRAALIQAHHRIYLAGDPSSDAFVAGLRDLFDQDIYPNGAAQGQTAYAVYYAGGWEAPLREVILREREPIPGWRQAYEFDLAGSALADDWRGLVPSGLEMVTVDRALVEDARLDNLEDLREELLSERASVDEFLARSFGVCLRTEREIVTWCLSEYNTGARCEVGIATHPGYRRRGLAAASGLAFLEMARARGMRRVGWHCWQDNHGSVATALRLGFRKTLDYPSFEAFFDPVVHLAVRGHLCLEQGDYPAADAWLERALSSASAPVWAYVASACAAARQNDAPKAFLRLREAIARGYDNRTHLEENEHLAGLRTSSEWGRLWESP